MTVVFLIKELEDVVAPHNLIDVLDSLVDNDYVESYGLDWETGEVVIDVPAHVEISEIFKGFEDLRESKPKRNLQ
jgi:hypothetical protein